MKRVEASVRECYKISLSIGNSPDLSKMLGESLRAYRKELQAISCAVFTEEETPRETGSSRKIFSITHTTGRSQPCLNIIGAIERKLQGRTIKSFLSSLPATGNIAGGQHYCIMALPGFGFLVLVWENAESGPELMKALEPLNRNLAAACRGCDQRMQLSLQNRQLTEEILQHRQTRTTAHRQASQLGLIYDAGRKLSGVLEPAALFSLIVETVHEAFDYTYVSILELDSISRTLAFKATAGELQQASRDGLKLKMGQGMIGRAAETGKAQISGDVVAHPYYIRHSNEPTRSELAVPVISGHHVIAVLDIQSDQYDAFNEMDIMVVETLADQMAICIENARLYGELQIELNRREYANEITRTMFRISNAVGTTFNLEELLRSIHRILGRIIDVTNFHISLYNRGEDSLTFAYIVDTVDKTGKFTTIENLCDPGTASHTAEVIKTGEPVLHKKKDFLELLEQRGLEPLFSVSEIWLGVPLKIRGDITGAVVVHSFTNPDLYTQKDVDLLVSVSDHIAYAIERKRAEEERKKLVEQLYQSRKVEAVGTLAGGMAHDFNNLLSVIMGNISMAAEETGAIARTCLQEAEAASFKASELTGQLITFSKGSAPVKKKRPLSGLIREAALSVGSNGKVNYEFNIHPDLWEAEFDRDQMKRALINIVENAADFTPEGGTVQVDAENLQLDSEIIDSELLLSRGRYLKITFRDNGIGIAEKHLPMIFDPYFTTKEMGVQKGMGLGLATTHAIVSRHNGQLSVRSVKDEGTTVSIFLPAAIEPTERIPHQSQLRVEGEADRPKKILVMDGEMMIRDLSVRMLEKLGYDAVVAENGETAVEKFNTALKSGRRFGVVILDLTVEGGLGGNEVVSQMVSRDPRLKAIVSSGYSDDPVMNDYTAHGFSGALAKPYSWETLKNLLDDLF